MKTHSECNWRFGLAVPVPNKRLRVVAETRQRQLRTGYSETLVARGDVMLCSIM